MPRNSDEVESSAYLRLLVLGAPKSGKTQTVISTMPPGGTYVINSDDAYSLRPAARVCKFSWDLATGEDPTAIEKCIHEARTGVKEGRYKAIVWDTLTKYAGRCEEAFARATENAKGEPDGRRYWSAYRKHLHNILDRLFALKAHVIVNAHYIDNPGALVEGQVPKAGDGVVPMLGGQARVTIPAEFQDIVFLDKKQGRRYFTTSSDGVFGPGCRSLPGVERVDADVSALWRMMQKPSSKPAREVDGARAVINPKKAVSK